MSRSKLLAVVVTGLLATTAARADVREGQAQDDAVLKRVLCTAVNDANQLFTAVSRIRGIAAARALRKCETAAGSVNCRLQGCVQALDGDQDQDEVVDGN